MTGRRRFARSLMLMVCGLLFASPLAFAQATGTLNGRVLDQAEAVLPGASVTATNNNTGIVRATVANAEGVYSLPGLEPGAYTVKAELSGFSAATFERVSLAVNATLTLDFKLGLAGVAENVTVSGAAPLIEVTQSKVNLVIRTKEVAELPLLTRNVNTLLGLLPGSKVVAPSHPYKRESGSVSAGGSAGRTSLQTIDGADNRDNVVGGAAVNITVEGIEQFQVASHQFAAADGRASGSAITILTKSGTNELRGSGFFYGRDDALQAKDYFAAHDNRPKPPFNRQQYGGSVGGPIRQNRAFFFGAVEGIQEKTSTAVPDSLYNEMQLLAPFGAQPVHAILQPFWDARYLAKATVTLTPSHSLVWRYAGEMTHRQQPSATQNSDVSVPGLETHKFNDVVGQHSWIIGSGTLNQLTGHLSQFVDYLGPMLNGGQPVLSQLPATIQVPITNNLIFPSVRIGQPVTPGSSWSGQTMGQVRDDLSLQRGSHALKMGVDYSWFPKLGGECCNAGGSFTFFDDPSVIVSNSNGRYPQGFQTPGIVRQWADTAHTVYSNYNIAGAKQFKAYFQDDWRLRPRFTLNFGIRYDLDLGLYDQANNAQNLTYRVLQAIGHPYGRGLPETPTRDFGPRVGFAYDLRGDGRRVVRGGYGLYIDQICQTGNFPISAQNHPSSVVTSTSTNTGIGIGELGTYRFGIDAPPPQPPASNGLPPGARSNGNWFDPDVRNGRNHHFHVGYSHELSSQSVLSVDYTHVQGLNDAKTVQANPLVNGVRVLAPAMAAVLGDANLLGSINIFATIGRTRYDELAVQFEHRLPRAIFRASYTLSGAYAYGGSIVGSQAPCCQAQDQFNLFAPGEWGPTVSDERHRIVATGIFLLPGGIQLAPIFQAATARPYTLTAGVDLNADGTNNDRYVDPVSGAQVAVNSQRGDPFVLLDLRATKVINLASDRRRLSVFAEVFNLLNTANFGQSYNGNSRSVAFRQPVGFIPGGGYPFQVQLGARLEF
jgi:hypothetical protein